MMNDYSEIFSEEDYEIVKEAILATIPAFRNGLVYQPNLNENSSIVAKVLALADLADAGMVPKKEFTRQSFALFREENLDIKEVLENLDLLTDQKKQGIIRRIKAWIQFQILFINSRKIRFFN